MMSFDSFGTGNAIHLTTKIEIVKQSLHFSAAHFTIFSATERENLHGHNFQVQAVIHCGIGDDGIAFDYNIAKNAIQTICDRLDEHMLLPTESPHLDIKSDENEILVRFSNETLSFRSRDVLLLPIRNTTVEELSRWVLKQLLKETNFRDLPIHQIEVKIASGSGQWGIAQARLK